MPPHVAETARASGCGKPGAPATPATTSSRPARERIATPFQVGSPCAAYSYPRSASSARSRAAKASSASLVSCRQTTSGRRSSSHGSSRGRRCLTELTFQVAMRTGPRLGDERVQLADRQREAGEVGLTLAGERAQERLQPAGGGGLLVQEALDGEDRLGAGAEPQRRLGEPATRLEGILAHGLQRPPLHPRRRAHAGQL